MTQNATVFSDVSGRKAGPVPLPRLLATIEAGKPNRDTKESCPLFSALLFGNQRTDRGSLRSTANALHACAVVAEHDAGTLTPELARDIASARLPWCVHPSPNRLPEFIGNDAEVWPLEDVPFGAWTVHSLTAAGVGILHPLATIPDVSTDVDLVIE